MPRITIDLDGEGKIPAVLSENIWFDRTIFIKPLHFLYRFYISTYYDD